MSGTTPVGPASERRFTADVVRFPIAHAVSTEAWLEVVFPPRILQEAGMIEVADFGR